MLNVSIFNSSLLSFSVSLPCKIDHSKDYNTSLYGAASLVPPSRGYLFSFWKIQRKNFLPFPLSQFSTLGSHSRVWFIGFPIFPYFFRWQLINRFFVYFLTTEVCIMSFTCESFVRRNCLELISNLIIAWQLFNLVKSSCGWFFTSLLKILT